MEVNQSRIPSLLPRKTSKQAGRRAIPFNRVVNQARAGYISFMEIAAEAEEEDELEKQDHIERSKSQSERKRAMLQRLLRR